MKANRYLKQTNTYVVVKGKVIKLTLDFRGLWVDEWDTVWALTDDSASVDLRDNCGLDPLSLPSWHIFQELNKACAAHDFKFSSPAYQYFHTRQEADAELEADIKKTKYFWWVAKPFRWIASKFPSLWENERTR